MTAVPRDVFFCGTIPLEHEVDVFKALAELGGARLRRIPDGELGDRKMWVIGQYSVLAECPALEPGAYPADGLTRRTSYQIPLTLRQGAKESDIAFHDLGYARHARASYLLFREMKKAGKLPSHWRLQVNLPTPMDVMPMIHPDIRPAAEQAYKKEMLKEIAQIERDIPHGELAITWDVVQAVLIWEQPDNNYVVRYFDNPKQGYLDRLVELGKAVDRDVELGYHLCYGSQDNRHALEPRDLSACVDLINAVASGLSRKIDYVHMPVPRDRSDDPFFAPLGRLEKSRIGEVYLGLVHYTDGMDGARRRIAAASRHLPTFGIAAECGFGRRPSSHDIHELIKLHGDVAAAG